MTQHADRYAERPPEDVPEEEKRVGSTEEHSVGFEALGSRSDFTGRCTGRKHVGSRTPTHAQLTWSSVWIVRSNHVNRIWICVNKILEIHLDATGFGWIVVRDDEQSHSQASRCGATL